MTTKTKKRAAAKGQPRATKQWPVDGVATLEEAASFLRIHRITLWRLIKAGRFPQPVPVGTTEKRIAWSVLHDYAAGRLTAAPSTPTT